MAGADFPALPSAVGRLLEPDDPEGLTSSRLREILEADPGLADRFVRAVNSPAFEFEAEVASVHRAIALLPSELARDLSIALAVHAGLFEAAGSRRLERQRFWLHTLAVAAASREIARQTRLAPPLPAWVAGLLHDAGKVLLERRDVARYDAFLRELETYGDDPHAREVESLGTDHARLGAEACVQWGLPRAIADAVAVHHRPSEPGSPEPLGDAVHVADFLAWSGGLGSHVLARRPVLDAGAADRVGFARLDKPRIRTAIDREVTRAARILGLAVPDPDRIREALEDTSVELSRLETRFRETRRTLARRATEISAVSEAIARARRSGETHVVLREILGAVHEGLGFDRVFLFLPEPGGLALRGRLVAGGEARAVDPDDLRIPIDPSTDPCFVTFTRAAHGQGPLAVGPHERAEADWLARHSIDEMGLVPLRVEGEILGVIGVDQSASRVPIEASRLESLAVLAQEAGLVLEKARLAQRARELAVTDDLTEVANRKRWLEALDGEFERARRYDRPLSIALVDVDRFALFNRAHGPNAGDEVLRGLARLLDQLSRTTDLVGRHGGEEFSLLLPETTIADAVRFGERIRRAFGSFAAKIAARFPGPPLTVSLGVAGWSAEVPTPAALVRRAEAALARAKATGRDRVEAEAE